MKLLLLCVGVALCAAMSPEDIKSAFADFKYTYNRQYRTVDEEAQYFDCFAQNMAKIEELNAKDTALHGINRFADICAQDFKRTHHNLRFQATNATKAIWLSDEVVRSTPTSIDWRTKGAVVGIKNQEQCGSCWAFSAVAAMEGAFFLAGHPLLSLSEEELVQCASTAGAGCDGGDMDLAIQWVVKNGGINSERAYPYTSGDGNTGICNKNKEKVSVAKFTALVKVPQNEAQVAAYLVSHGPLFIGVDAGAGWQSYQSGIMTDCSGRSLDHGVAIVGMEPTFWIVKNSWGVGWGENGYIRLQRGVDCDGLTTEAGTATVAKM